MILKALGEKWYKAQELQPLKLEQDKNLIVRSCFGKMTQKKHVLQDTLL